jgi:hypothetical protein
MLTALAVRQVARCIRPGGLAERISREPRDGFDFIGRGMEQKSRESVLIHQFPRGGLDDSQGGIEARKLVAALSMKYVRRGVISEGVRRS